MGHVRYIDKTREYYQGEGYATPYRWAHFDDVPFTPLAKPLAECTMTIVTTAAPYRPHLGDQRAQAPYNAAAKFYVPYTMDTSVDHDVRVSHVGIDRKHTSMEDSNCWFPLPVLRAFARIKAIRLAPRFHGAPTDRSHRATLQRDCPELLKRVREDKVDAVVLVAV